MGSPRIGGGGERETERQCGVCMHIILNGKEGSPHQMTTQ